MKFYALVLVTHGSAAVIAGGAVAAVWLTGGSPWLLAAAGLVSLLAVLGASWFLSQRVIAGLHALGSATTSDRNTAQTTQILEFDQTLLRLWEQAERWAEMATISREQRREVDALLAQLDSQPDQLAGKANTSAYRIRHLLSGICTTFDTHLDQIIQHTSEIERCTLQIARGAEEQNEAVNRTATFVEQISTNIDAVSKNAGSAHNAATSTQDSSNEALELIRHLIRGMKQIVSNVESGEKRLRALGDHSQQVGSIVETIGNIASRTDLLALNASIESVRAGEHGRGFATVAEEVRKLAEQAAEATREVTGLIESMQLETQDSIVAFAQQRSDVEQEVQRVHSAAEALEHISQIARDSALRIGEIASGTQHQLQLAQDVVLAVERISNTAKSSRSRAEEASWTTKTLTTTAGQLDSSLSPLRSCTGNSATRRTVRNPAREVLELVGADQEG